MDQRASKKRAAEQMSCKSAVGSPVGSGPKFASGTLTWRLEGRAVIGSRIIINGGGRAPLASDGGAECAAGPAAAAAAGAAGLDAAALSETPM